MLLKNIKIFELNVSRETMESENLADLTGYSISYIERKYKSGERIFHVKRLSEGRHGKHKNDVSISRWAVLDTETCIKPDKSGARIWSFQIGLHPDYQEQFNIAKNALLNNKIRFYEYVTVFLFDNFSDFKEALIVLYNMGLRTLVVHNLKYDASWIQLYLKNKPSYSEEEHEFFSRFILHNGKLYDGDLVLNDKKVIRCYDSYKTFVGSLKSIAIAYGAEHAKAEVPEDFYKKYRDENYKFTELDIKYNSCDCLALAETIVIFDKIIYDLCGFRVMDNKGSHPRLRTSSSIAYKALEQSVKEYECISCDKKCEYYKKLEEGVIAYPQGKRKSCKKYCFAFLRRYPKFDIQSNEAKAALKAFYKGKSILLENPMADLMLEELPDNEKSTYGLGDINRYSEQLLTYSFDAYKGGVTLAPPEKSGKIESGEYSLSDIFGKEETYLNNDNINILSDFKYKKPTGWIFDYTSLYPSRMRDKMPEMKTYLLDYKRARKEFFENPIGTTKKIYGLRYDTEEYINDLSEFFAAKDQKRNPDIKFYPPFYNGYFMLYNIYSLKENGECVNTLTGKVESSDNKFFIVKAKIKFSSKFYFYQIRPRELTSEQLRRYNATSNPDKNTGFRAYQKDTVINNGIEWIECKIPLSELLFYSELVKAHGGIFDYKIIDGVGCDIKVGNSGVMHFIDTLGDIKSKSKGAKRSAVKLLMNGSYGKAGTKVIGLDKVLNETIYEFDGKYYVPTEDQTSEDFVTYADKCNFVPLACAVTSAGRMHLFAPNVDEQFLTTPFKARIDTQKTGGYAQAQCEGSGAYSDTDSVYILNIYGYENEAQVRKHFGFKGDGKELGEFKMEGILIAFKTLGAKRKQYITYEDGKLFNHTTLAGCNSPLKFSEFSRLKTIDIKKSTVNKELGIIEINDSTFKIMLKDERIFKNEEVMLSPLIKRKVVDL